MSFSNILISYLGMDGGLLLGRESRSMGDSMRRMIDSGGDGHIPGHGSDPPDYRD